MPPKEDLAWYAGLILFCVGLALIHPGLVVCFFGWVFMMYPFKREEIEKEAEDAERSSNTI